jgi:peptide/nickel transport system ATP-binding protein
MTMVQSTAIRPLMEARNVSVSFILSSGLFGRVSGRRQTLTAVDGVSLSVFRGETFALLGESGCGKSMLARTLVGLYPPTSGSLIFDGRSVPAVAGARDKDLRRRIQMIFQDPYTSLNPRWRVRDIVAEPFSEHRPLGSKADITERVGDLLERVGLLRGDMQKFPHQFSGGQRQRIAIARALSTRPEFLVCDEPTSALDVSVQAQVLNLLRELQEIEAGLTCLFISHNLAAVHHLADRVGVMYLGRLVELAPKRDLFAMPLHPYTRMLLAAVPRLERPGISRTPIAGEVPNPIDPPSGCTFHPRCPLAKTRCRAERPQLRVTRTGDNPEVSLVACHAVEEGRA